jgi:arginyl-tRNA synthetase
MRVPTDAAASSQEIAAPQFGHAHRVINVIDVRQSYPQQVVYESLRRLGYVEQADNSLHLAYGMVTLSATTAASLGVDTSSGREFYAMSGRKGLEIKADDLINAAVARLQAVESTHQTSDETAAILAASAIRYFLIRLGLQQTIVLDIDEVLRPTGETGVYLHYAYARARGILRRLEEQGYAAPERWEGLPEHLDQSEWELLRQIDLYPRRLAEATGQLAPNLLAASAFDLATHFSAFFEHTAPLVRETDQRVKAFRAHLVEAAAQTMANVLRTLGCVPLETI